MASLEELLTDQRLKIETGALVGSGVSIITDQLSPATGRPRLVVEAQPDYSITSFAAQALERAKGSKIEFDDLYLAYRAAAAEATAVRGMRHR